ncbi:ANR family transcriptional regulator [Candidatus Symbiopectobacterium sp. NZEC135]|uniref:ANR family transcriptional regulator n=1 Tax=Candidatus Symbiopectobacterium sp. NZEC135 TaxID=2820471 RepID=UPI0022273CAC|nr:ANR family transcriptional regulator [Candidatus Symbiopectobacterium sp. NZEC135]MCW2477705.1 ANR family transcriptional regulator [Candidatus Symbiopectobacterium sp. NZEC135]
MNDLYLTAAKTAGELERACKYAQAKVAWIAAEEYARGKFKKYCNIRAEFCEKFGSRLESWSNENG